MKTIKKAMNSRWGFTLLTNIATLLVSLFMFRPYWEENDDIWISALTEGAFGDHEPHVLFSNIIYGKLLCTLQNTLSGIRWHAVLEIIFIFVISTAFVYVLAKDYRGKIISAVFLLGSAYEIYVALQFSKIPAFIGMAGYIILFELVSDKDLPTKIKKTICLAAWISIFFAIILRPDSFLLATLVAGVYGLVRVIREIAAGEFICSLRRYCLYFMPVAAIYILCLFVNRVGYSDPEWSRFREYEKLEGVIVDYNYDSLIYNEHGKELADIGVSENDAFMFLTWQFADDEYLTPELIEKIASIGPKGLQKIDVNMLKAWIANIHETILVLNPLILALVMILAMYLIYTIAHGRRSYRLAHIITQMILTVGVLFYYQYSGRWSHRVVYALLLCQFILFVYLIKDEEILVVNPTTIQCITAVLLLSLCTLRLTNEFEYQEYRRTAFDQQELITYMQNNKDKLFVADTFTIQGFDKYNVFKASEKGQFDNLVQVGGSHSNSPVAKRIVRSYGYENPFRALEGRDERVILIDNVYPDRKIQYCNEHGDGGRYQLSDLGTVGGLHLYSIR